MQPTRKQFLLIGAGVLAVALIGFGVHALYTQMHPLPEYTTFRSSHYSFEYPRAYRIEEYASGVISVGTETEEGFQSLVEVVRYQNDREAPRQPRSYAEFLNTQLLYLCGGDEPNQEVACAEPAGVAYQSPTGFQGQQFDLTLMRTDTVTDTTTSYAFGPVYAFDITDEGQEPPVRYTTLIVYPSLDAVRKGIDTSEVERIVMQTLDLTPDGGSGE